MTFPVLPRDVEAYLNLIKDDDDKCVQAFFQIKDKYGALVPFHYNRAQRLHKERSTDFDMVLKARKLGISSRRIALDLWKCATRKHQHRVALTHTGDAMTKMMEERVKPFIKNCLFPLGAVERRDHIYFPHTDSRYYVGTAGSKKFGRGDDISGYHLLEYAHWQSPDVVSGIEQALVENADGLVETTAKGHNFFKNDWEKAKRKENQYRAIFLPWYSDEGYEKPVESEPGHPTEEEQGIISAFGLKIEQIAWRRWKKRTMREPELFQQEYPETDEQAFLSSGRPVLDWIALARMRAFVSPPKLRGYLMRQHDRVVLVQDKEGPLRIWKIPESGHVYAIGSDVAEGLKGGAYSTGEVLDVGDSEQVAEWHGHCTPDLLAGNLELLSYWYNHALIIPEEYPGPGEVTASHLVLRKARVWKAVDGTRYGWQNNRATKTALMAEFNASIRDFALTLRSPDLLDECHSYVYVESKVQGYMAMEPSLGNFSDRLMGMAIAWFCTRDLAERVDYYRAKKPEFIGQLAGGTSVPKRSGPLPGRRNS